MTLPPLDTRATPTATLSPTPARLPTATADQFHAACPSGQGFGDIYQSGDSYIAVSLIGLAYPAAKLPDGVPLDPFKLPSDAGDLHGLPQSPEVNPELEHTGIMVEYCNGAKSASHRVEGVSVRIDRFTPYTGALNSWQFCDGFYTNGQVNGGGCGGHFFADEYLHATFDSTASAGATRSADFIKVVSDDSTLPPLPVNLSSGQSVLLEVALTAPTVAGNLWFLVQRRRRWRASALRRALRRPVARFRRAQMERARLYRRRDAGRTLWGQYGQLYLPHLRMRRDSGKQRLRCVTTSGIH